MEVAKRVTRNVVSRLPLGQGVRVELVRASDSVAVVGTYVLDTEQDRVRLLEAIEAIQALRATRTSFRDIDEGLADVLRRDLRAEEQPAVLLVTDAISDDPSNDFAATDLGRRAVVVGAGLYAVWSGALPAEPLPDRPGSSSSRLPPTRGTQGRAHVLDIVDARPVQLQASAQQLVPRVELLGPIFGQRPSAEFNVTLNNPSPCSRAISLEAQQPAGTSVSFDPPVATVPPGGAALVRVRLELTGSVSVSQTVLRLIARSPGQDAALPAMVRVDLASPSWIRDHWGKLFALLAGSAALGFVLASVLRRSVRVSSPSDPDAVAVLGPGEGAELSLFKSTLPSGAGRLERDALGRWFVRAQSTPITVGGRSVSPGKRTRYQLGEMIVVQGESLCIGPVVEGVSVHRAVPSDVGSAFPTPSTSSSAEDC